MLASGDSSLHDLHITIQVSLGWNGDHHHVFPVNREEYGDASNKSFRFVDEKTVKISELRLTVNSKFDYVYDFGDNWRHEIKIESISPATPETSVPICLDGARACPPEDCGGVRGYAFYQNLSSKPINDLSDRDRDALGCLEDQEYDFERFNLEVVNRTLTNCRFLS